MATEESISELRADLERQVDCVGTAVEIVAARLGRSFDAEWARVEAALVALSARIDGLERRLEIFAGGMTGIN